MYQLRILQNVFRLFLILIGKVQLHSEARGIGDDAHETEHMVVLLRTVQHELDIVPLVKCTDVVVAEEPYVPVAESICYVGYGLLDLRYRWLSVFSP